MRAALAALPVALGVLVEAGDGVGDVVLCLEAFWKRRGRGRVAALHAREERGGLREGGGVGGVSGWVGDVEDSGRAALGADGEERGVVAVEAVEAAVVAVVGVVDDVVGVVGVVDVVDVVEVRKEDGGRGGVYGLWFGSVGVVRAVRVGRDEEAVFVGKHLLAGGGARAFACVVFFSVCVPRTVVAKFRIQYIRRSCFGDLRENVCFCVSIERS